MKIVLVAVPLINSRVPPLSIACLAAYMRHQGHEVKSFDFNIETYHAVGSELKEYWTFYRGFQWLDNEHFEKVIYPQMIAGHIELWLERILKEKPDIVGISMTDSPTGQRLARRIRQAAPHVKIIIGGPVCSKSYAHPEMVPGAYFDAVVHNEGEITLGELVTSYEKTGKFAPTLGASVLGENGEVVFPGLRPAQMELDNLPTPDFDDFDFALYVDADTPGRGANRDIPYWSSRGCPARCNFCMDYKMWDLRYRQKSPARIVEELEFLSKRYGISDFMLIELIFNGHMGKMRELSRELIRRNLKLTFWGHGRIDGRMDLETLTELKAAGFKWFIFGLESASDRVLKLMRKGYTKETADRVLTNMRTVGINCSVNIICGFPGESWDDFRETIEFIYKHRMTIGMMPGLADCAVAPGSDLYLYPEKFSIEHPHGGKPDSLNWRTVDGTNTREVRLFRKEFMLKIFKQIRFKFSGPEDRQLSIEQMPDPETEFRALYPEHP